MIRDYIRLIAEYPRFPSALSPVLFGWLLDGGFTIDDLVFSGVVSTVGVSVLAYFAPLPSRTPRAR